MSIRRVTVDSPGMQRVLKVLRERGPMDEKTLAPLAYVSPRTLHNYAIQLHHGRHIYAHAWRYNRQGSQSAIWAIGPGEDAPKLPPSDKVARNRDWRQRTGYWEAKKADKRLANPDRLTAALMGIRP